ncbi:uncharacterized protein ASPGLDRAFT_1503041 [Aspergillus glaucus CBS 516.65]|uniref:Uncharacterized protein n=1 Tax=Aspergillus glaucus CBS 516.65 TaxID=1160497 RepID=A0A1L9V7V3_ASPGL|nr:hypothetical protein ASPGLDRAFT_1503041 [Aspergillus glaucus CBS 516.65]OJJ79975.1 hypothetical protein ASPGLDRAFT_1503041 [Aspergillus glaucus CBS 516.65]
MHSFATIAQALLLVPGGDARGQLIVNPKNTVNCKDTTTRSNGPSNGPTSRIGIASAQPEPEDPACKCKFVSSGLIEQVEDFHPKELSDCIVLLRNVQKGTEEQRRQKFCSNHTIVLARKLSLQTEAVGINHITTRIGQLAGKHETLTQCVKNNAKWFRHDFDHPVVICLQSRKSRSPHIAPQAVYGYKRPAKERNEPTDAESPDITGLALLTGALRKRMTWKTKEIRDGLNKTFGTDKYIRRRFTS